MASFPRRLPRLLLLAFVPLTGCSSTSDGAGSSSGADSRGSAGSSGASGSSSSYALADLPAALAAATCGPLETCCRASSIVDDEQACETAVVAKLQPILDDVAKAGGVTYDADAGAACVSAVRGYYGACERNQDAFAAVQATCSQVFVGTGALGAACTLGAQCIASSGDASVQCNPMVTASGQDVATCGLPFTPPPHGQHGDSCGGSCNDIACGSSPPPAGVTPGAAMCFQSDGLYCEDATRTCQPDVARGAACPGLFGCDDTSRCVSGVCVALAAAGESCMTYFDCAPALTCGPSGTCVARGATGSACAQDDQCVQGICNGGLCVDTTSLAWPGVCSGVLIDDPFGPRFEGVDFPD